MSGVPSEGGIEGRGPIVPVEVGTLDAIGAALARAGAPEIRGQTEVPQDPFHRAGVFNQREEPQPPATTGALKHIEPERPSHQIFVPSWPTACSATVRLTCPPKLQRRRKPDTT